MMSLVLARLLDAGGVRPEMPGYHYKPAMEGLVGMRCCKNPRLVYTDEEVVCSNCGVTRPGEEMEVVEHEPVTKVLVSEEERLGSPDIAPSSILRSKKHANILRTRTNPMEKKMADACNKLGLHQGASRRALNIFKRLMDVRKGCTGGYGGIAFFALYQTCREYGIRHKNDDYSKAVSDAFSLRRRIRPQKAIFQCESMMLSNNMSVDIRYKDSEQKRLEGLDTVVQQRAYLQLKKTYPEERAVQIVRRMFPA